MKKIKKIKITLLLLLSFVFTSNAMNDHYGPLALVDRPEYLEVPLPNINANAKTPNGKIEKGILYCNLKEKDPVRNRSFEDIFANQNEFALLVTKPNGTLTYRFYDGNSASDYLYKKQQERLKQGDLPLDYFGQPVIDAYFFTVELKGNKPQLRHVDEIKDPIYTFIMANKRYQEQKLEEAKSVLNKLLNSAQITEDLKAQSNILLGSIFLKENKSQEAEQSLKKALRSGKLNKYDMAQVQYLLGGAYMKQGKDTESKAYFEFALGSNNLDDNQINTAKLALQQLQDKQGKNRKNKKSSTVLKK